MMLYKPLKDVTRINIGLAARALLRAPDLRADRRRERDRREARAPDAAPVPPGDPLREGLLRATATSRSSRTSTSRSGAARPSRSSARPEPERRRSSICSRGSTTRPADAITFDGVDLRDATLASLRAPDRPRHAGDDPLRLAPRGRTSPTARPAPPEETVRAAARAAYADEFVERLPEGYDTPARRGRRAPLRRPETAARHRARDLQGRARS